MAETPIITLAQRIGQEFKTTNDKINAVDSKVINTQEALDLAEGNITAIDNSVVLINNKLTLVDNRSLETKDALVVTNTSISTLDVKATDTKNKLQTAQVELTKATNDIIAINDTLETLEPAINVLPLSKGGLGNVDGHAVTADKLSVAKTISISGDMVGAGQFDGSASLVLNVKADLGNIDGHIIPSGHRTQDIGSPTHRFRKIYVDEAMLSINTLYIGDTPILGTSADTIMIKADHDQSIQMRTSGVGSTQIQSASEVLISTNGMNADVKLQATGTNSKVRLGGTGGVEVSAAMSVQDNLSIIGNLTLGGNLIMNGAAFEINATTVTTKDNIIVINKGEIGEGVTAGKAGIQVDRGDAPDFQFIFDETIDKFVIGMVGSTFEVVATREYVTGITDTKVDKVVGKVLTSNDFTNDYKTLVDTLKTKVAELSTTTAIVILN